MCFGLLSAVLLVHHILALDNLELLGESLRTYQKVSCDGQTITLDCPPGTCISVQMAQYLTTTPSVCTTNAITDVNSTCLWVSTIQTVVEACQKKRQCQLLSPAHSVANLCPHRRNFITVHYKCRPYEFRNTIVCQNDVLQIRCNPNTRVAVYSASFGRVEYESVRCQQPQGVREETCLVSYATENVMRLCHGKRHCNLSASTETFGNPCHPQSRLYLKVVYTCVHRNVFQDEYILNLFKDEVLAPDPYADVTESSIREDASPQTPYLIVSGRRHNGSILLVPNSSLPGTTESITEKTLPGKEENIPVTINMICLGIILSVLLLVLVRSFFGRYRCVPNHGRVPGDKAMSEGTTAVDIGVDLTAITSSSVVTVLPSP